MRNILALVLSLLFINGCSTFAYFNEPLGTKTEPPEENRAQFTIERDRGNDDTLFILSLSGGGSRAAYLSSQVMLALQDIPADDSGRNLLQSVDAISSVSGGSLPAAYYAISKDPDDKTDEVVSGRVWERKTVEELMSKNYIIRWIANWFWPDNIALYWATAYDRSDIMAKTFADNMYDTSIAGFDLKFKDINKERPYIIINSTSGTSHNFGEAFTFTHEDFLKLKSDISQYDVSRAVMASASFPAVFNYVTLRDFSYEGKGKRHVHVFDGGNFDNLGLASTRRLINLPENDKYKNVVILLVDAFTKPKGVPNYKYDALEGLDYAIDLNFFDSTDSLLKNVRKDSVLATKTLVKELEAKGKKAVFYHLSFRDIEYFKGATAKITEYDSEKDEDVTKDIPLGRVLNNISTNFSISDNNKNAIAHAVKLLITKENNCLKKIQSLVSKGSIEENDPHCRWPEEDMSVASTD